MDKKITELLKGRSLSSIPVKELERLGYVRIKIAGVTHLLDKKRLEKDKALAMYLLSGKAKDYLYSHNRENLRYFLGEKKILTSESLLIISKRVKKLKRNSIPGIFREEFEGACKPLPYEGLTYHRFANVDFLINLFNGRLRPHPFMIKERPPEYWEYDYNFWSYFGICSLEDIVAFGNYATNRNQEERILREIICRTNRLSRDFSSEEVKDFILQRLKEIFKEVVRIFEESGFPRPLLKEYGDEGLDVVAIVKKPFWYCYYNVRDVNYILQRFEDSAVKIMIEQRTTGLDRLRFMKPRSIRLLKKVFPDICQNIKRRVYDRIKTLIKTVPNYEQKTATQISEELGGFPRTAIAKVKRELESQ